MILFSFLISALYLTLLWLDTKSRIMYPDSERYRSMSEGIPQYKPFHLRWLLPKILKSESDWNFVNISSLILIAPLTYTYLILNHCTEFQALFGVALACGLPGVYFINYYAKYLTDSFGMFTALASACAFLSGYWEAGIIISLIGSCANEKVFIYSALFGWNAWGLIGGLAVLVRYLLVKPAPSDILGEHNHKILDHPLKSGIQFHKGKIFNGRQMLLTWGVCLVAFVGFLLINITQFWVVLLVAYGSVFLATDSVRLYQWAFPVMILATVKFIPVEWALVLTIIHWFNPVRKDILKGII